MQERDDPGDRTYTLAELSDEIGRRLARSGVSPASARVSPIPDGRTLRYYTTLGLLDRPLEVRDRQARYGERHILQALAIKALQSAGHSLAVIQVALAGLDERELATVGAGGQRGARGGGERFWARTVASAAASPQPASAVRAPEGPTAGQRGEADGSHALLIRADEIDAPHVQTVIALAPGVSLVLDGTWQFDDVDTLHTAAGELLQALSAAQPSPRAGGAGTLHSPLLKEQS
jgi:DNA-binding transcriptional MerR regulator